MVHTEIHTLGGRDRLGEAQALALRNSFSEAPRDGKGPGAGAFVDAQEGNPATR